MATKIKAKVSTGTEDSNDILDTATSIGSLIPGVGGLIGGALSFAQNTISKSEWKHQREIEDMEAMAKNRSDRERMMAMSPEADRQASASTLQSGRAANMGNALNASTGQSLKAGLGGDVQAGNIGAIKGSMAASAASAPYDQALSEGFGKRQQAQFQQNDALSKNSDQLSVIANRASMYEDETNNPYSGLGSAILGGANAATSIGKLMGLNATVTTDPITATPLGTNQVPSQQAINQPTGNPTGLFNYQNALNQNGNIFGWQKPPVPFSLARP